MKFWIAASQSSASIVRKMNRPKLSRPRRYSSHASCIVGRSLAEFFGFEVRELEPQAFEYSLGDAVLQEQMSLPSASMRSLHKMSPLDTSSS